MTPMPSNFGLHVTKISIDVLCIFLFAIHSQYMSLCKFFFFLQIRTINGFTRIALIQIWVSRIILSKLQSYNHRSRMSKWSISESRGLKKTGEPTNGQGHNFLWNSTPLLLEPFTYLVDIISSGAVPFSVQSISARIISCFESKECDCRLFSELESCWNAAPMFDAPGPPLQCPMPNKKLMNPWHQSKTSSEVGAHSMTYPVQQTVCRNLLDQILRPSGLLHDTISTSLFLVLVTVDNRISKRCERSSTVSL